VSDALRFEQLETDITPSLALIFEVVLNNQSLENSLSVGLLSVEAHLVTENDDCGSLV